MLEGETCEQSVQEGIKKIYEASFDLEAEDSTINLAKYIFQGANVQVLGGGEGKQIIRPKTSQIIETY